MQNYDFNTNKKFQSIEEKINKLLQQAEKYTHFLFQRHQQTLKPKANDKQGSRRRKPLIGEEILEKEDENFLMDQQ